MKKYDVYKDSGVKWIGEIPEHWKIAPLKSCFNVLSGATPKSTELSYWEDGDINWITPADFKTEDRFISDGAKKITKEGFISCSTSLIPSGSIIFSKRAPIGSVVINRNEVCTNQGCLSCIPKDDISSLFFYYIMSVSQKYFDMLGTGTTFNEISANVFKNVHLPVPPLSEQQVIASYLDAKTEKIDQMIAKAEKKIEYLGELKQSLITRAVTRGLNPKAPLKNSGVKWIGDIPRHWDVAPLKRYLKSAMKYGANESAEDDNPTWPRYIRITDIDMNGNLRPETFKSLNPEKAKDYLLSKGNVLFARSGATVGKTFIYNDEQEACFAGYLIKASCDKKLLPMYLFRYTQSGAYENWKNSIFIQATIQNIGADKYSYLPITIPPIREQQKIIQFLDTKCSKIDHIIATQKKKIAYLQELKQSLITNVVTGKIKVS